MVKRLKDLYEILNVSRDATEDEIKKAYRTLAKKLHPDLNPDDSEAEQQFKEATAAYEILSNPEKRARYDTYGHDGVDPQGQGFGDFGDIFGDIFDIFGGGFSTQSSRRTGPIRGADLRYDLEIEFQEAVFGIEKEIQVHREEECSTCDGSGAKPGTDKEQCSKCNGRGEVRYAQQTPLGQFVRVGTCDVCQGTGEIIKDKCQDCSGSGREMKTRKILVKIPAGVDNNSIISIRSEGEMGQRGGPSGDLFIYISVKEDSTFTRQGNDLFLDIPITFTEAALGVDIDVPTLKGSEKYTIPPGTQTGSEFRIKNQGVPKLRGRGRGDLYFKTNIEVPLKLNDKQRELLIEFSKESGEEYKEHKKGFFEKVKDAFQ